MSLIEDQIKHAEEDVRQCKAKVAGMKQLGMKVGAVGGALSGGPSPAEIEAEEAALRECEARLAKLKEKQNA